MTRTLLSLAAATLLYAAPAAAEVRVPFADLDLSSGAGAGAFDARAAAAARSACAVGRLVNDNCVRRVQQEAVRALPATRQEDYARARRGERILAMVAPAWVA